MNWQDELSFRWATGWVEFQVSDASWIRAGCQWGVHGCLWLVMLLWTIGNCPRPTALLHIPSPTDEVEGDFRFALYWFVCQLFKQFFVCALRYSSNIWCIALPYQITDKFEFGPLIFHKVMAHGLRKISWITSFLHVFSSIWYKYLFDIWWNAV
jgi:hypothetical protein